MSTQTPLAPAPSGAGTGPVHTRRRLPRAAPTGLYVAGVAVGALLSALTGFSIVLTVVYGAVLGTLAVYLVARRVEGRRKATDRLVTSVVTTAFLVAMVPLVSLVWTVLENGLPRLDSTFFNNSMLGIVGEGGGAYHAILGTHHHCADHGDLGADRPADRDLPGGVRHRQAEEGDHLLRRRHDRHPLHRRRPLRLALFALLFGGGIRLGSWARWRCRS